MELKLYDTLTREKRVFKPLDPARVRMYVCGPTVYDYAHIGNGRAAIVFDVLFRLLRHVYGPEHVAYVRNITDVDDKINDRAAERIAARGDASADLNTEIRALTEETYRYYREDVTALGCLPPTIEPRATEHIAEMKLLIERLVAGGHAYVADDHVLFSVPSMPDYGQLSKRPLDEMIAGARVEVAPYKRDPMDFVLWKPSKPGEPAWPSPAGIDTPGRPGWHIECSAMSWKHLGETFDIHGGGIDLVFPHHENEIAQSRCALRTPLMAHTWMHNGFLQVEGAKMSKSLGNFVTIRDLLQRWPGEVIRFQMLMTHYKQPLDWTEARCEEAARELQQWATMLSLSNASATAYIVRDRGQLLKPPTQIVEALGDDLNTAQAITELRALFREAKQSEELAFRFLCACDFLGLITHNRLWIHEAISTSGNLLMAKYIDDVRRMRTAVANGLTDTYRAIKSKLETGGVAAQVLLDGHVTLTPIDTVNREFNKMVEELIAARSAARKAKNYREADRIRAELAKMGVLLRDVKEDTYWEVAR